MRFFARKRRATSVGLLRSFYSQATTRMRFRSSIMRGTGIQLHAGKICIALVCVVVLSAVEPASFAQAGSEEAYANSFAGNYLAKAYARQMEVNNTIGRPVEQAAIQLKVFHEEWVRRTLQIALSLNEGDSYSPAASTLWNSLAYARREEALKFLVPRLHCWRYPESWEVPTETVMAWEIRGRTPVFPYVEPVASFGAQSLFEIERHIVTSDSPIPEFQRRLYLAQYGRVYGLEVHSDRLRKLVQLRLDRYQEKNWRSPVFASNAAQIMNDLARPGAAIKPDESSQLQSKREVPFTLQQRRMLVEYCGSVAYIDRASQQAKNATQAMWSLNRDCVPLRLGAMPDPKDCKTQAHVRLLHDLNCPDILPYMLSCLDYTSTQRPSMQLTNEHGEIGEYPYLEMALSYGELNTEELVKLLAKPEMQNLPEARYDRYVALLNRIYGTTPKDTQLTAELLRFYVERSPEAKSNIERCLSRLP